MTRAMALAVVLVRDPEICAGRCRTFLGPETQNSAVPKRLPAWECEGQHLSGCADRSRVRATGCVESKLGCGRRNEPPEGCRRFVATSSVEQDASWNVPVKYQKGIAHRQDRAQDWGFPILPVGERVSGETRVLWCPIPCECTPFFWRVSSRGRPFPRARVVHIGSRFVRPLGSANRCRSGNGRCPRRHRPGADRMAQVHAL